MADGRGIRRNADGSLDIDFFRRRARRLRRAAGGRFWRAALRRCAAGAEAVSAQAWAPLAAPREAVQPR